MIDEFSSGRNIRTATLFARSRAPAASVTAGGGDYEKERNRQGLTAAGPHFFPFPIPLAAYCIEIANQERPRQNLKKAITMTSHEGFTFKLSSSIDPKRGRRLEIWYRK